jgi:hypothetical protein
MIDQEFTVRKRICTAADGYQFITSGFPNRSRGGRAFESVDGMWAIDLLPGLGPREADMENPNCNRCISSSGRTVTTSRTSRRGRCSPCGFE